MEARTPGAQPLSREAFELLLEQCEQALLRVEARLDEPGDRHPELEVIEGAEDRIDEGVAAEVAEFRMAIAELVDAHGALPFDIEQLGDRVRALGPHAGAQELARRPALLDLAWLTLECLARVHPDRASFGADADAQEGYDALLRLRGELRARLN